MLSESVTQEIDKWLAKYPEDRRQSAVLTALRLAQESNGGYLTEPLMNAVADYLKIPAIAVYEAATFYTMYDLEPVGKHKINVCTNISCLLRGSDQVMKHLEKRLNIKCGETTKDGKFTLRHAECLAACVNAPMMQIDKTYHLDLTEEKINKIIAKLEEEA